MSSSGELAALRRVVVAEDVEDRAGAADDVAGELDVLDDNPRRPPRRVARRQHDGEAGLRAAPVVFHDVVAHPHPPRVLQLEQVLDGPRRAAPLRVLRQVVALDDDVGGDEVGDVDLGAAEEDVLAGGLEVVVADHDLARRVPAGDGLRVLADGLDVAHVAVDDGHVPALSAIARRCPTAGSPVMSTRSSSMSMRHFVIAWSVHRGRGR